MRRHPAKVKQKAVLVFTPRIKLLLVIILVRMLREIGNFRVAFFRLGLREVALSNMQQSNAFLNTVTRRI